MHRILLPFFLCGALVCSPLAATAITIDWVTVGDPGNAANPVDGDILTPGVQTFGAVDHSYLIGKYDVTWSQYVAFLNSNDPTGENLLGIYHKAFSDVIYDGGINFDPNASNGAKYSAMAGRGNRPANYVDFYQAARFANWLNNNQIPGSTETGAYTLLGNSDNPTNGETFTRNADAKVFLPSEDEWYKAAFYSPVTKTYYLYPTSSDTVPTGSAPTATPNSANFYPNGPYTLTDVGAYSGTTSPYGAFDMGGNVQQWNDTIINGNRRGIRGASFINTFEFMRSSTRGNTYPYNNIYGFGFRVAAVVPEPSSGVMGAIAVGMLWLLRGRIKRSKCHCRALLPALALCCAMYSAPAAAAITIDLVNVGNPGNADDATDGDQVTPGIQSYGAVDYAYRIGTTEVTNAQYAAFLNEKAQSDPYGLYNFFMSNNVRGGIDRSGVSGSFSYTIKSDMANKPVNHVSWFDSIRFINWLQNGQGAGDTETGAYTLLGGTPTPSNASSITRNTMATWFLPSEDEWYKSAYHQPATLGGDSDDYWAYSTATNLSPTLATANAAGDISNAGANVANHDLGAVWNHRTGNVTTVGSAGPLSASFYGTSDQGGNVWEWNEALVDGLSRGLRGGSWTDPSGDLAASVRAFLNPEFENSYVGFRVAAVVPEPSTGVMAAIAVGMLWLLRGRLKRARR